MGTLMNRTGAIHNGGLVRETRPKLATERPRRSHKLSAGTRGGMGAQGGADLGKVLPECGFAVEFGFHAFAGVDDGAVMPASEELGDGREGLVGQFAGQKHGALPGQDDAVGAFFAAQSRQRHAELPGDGFRNFRQRRGLRRGFGVQIVLGEGVD